MEKILSFAVLGIIVTIIVWFVCNAIYINNSIPMLDGWEKVTTGEIDCGYKNNMNCYNNNRDFFRSIGGVELNYSYRLYTPIPTWFGFETTTYSGLSYYRTYSLYKHNSLLPFWTDYLVICDK